jgi:Transport and Golgi organisation 2
MCTVSWIHEPDGYQLFCNRDEKRSRPAAEPPRLHERDGVLFLAPIDPAAGGTWIGVNENGVAICLLNRTENPNRTAPTPRSRGLLTWDLLTLRGAGSQPAASRLVSTLPGPTLHAPFTLLVLEPGRPALIADWDGQDLRIDPAGDARMPLISSSFDPIGVDTQRRAEFRRMVGQSGGVTASLLRSYHQSHAVCPSPYSVCMHRGDAQTVSFTRVRVAEDAIELAYSPQPLCANPEEESLTLERRCACVA